MTYQELGQFIKQERKKLKLTQKELADLAEVSKRTMQYVEAGQHFQIQTLTQILKAIGYYLELEMSVKKIKT